MMVPGLYAFETLGFFNLGEIFKARGDYIRLAAARFISQPEWPRE